MRIWKEGKLRITIKTPEEIAVMREGGRILGIILKELAEQIVPGISTKHIDDESNRLLKKYGVQPSFKGYNGYPASICTSINDEVVHGIPGKRILKDGDIITLDFGVLHKGFHTDSALTVGVGTIDEEKKRFIDTAEKSLKRAIEKAAPGIRIRDLSARIQGVVEEKGYSVVRDLVGHGIGHELHEDPMVPNFIDKDPGPMLQEGMTIAIEPIITMGGPDVKIKKDGWTFVTADGSLATHTEHTIVITKTGCEILTKRPE
jgi:methionyl aminopeptidase